MEYLETIQKRRSIRHYLDEPIDNNIINQILEEAILAPSAHNRQPWLFKIVNKEQKDWIASRMMEKNRETANTARVIKEAPVLILVFNSEIEQKLEDLVSIGGMIEQLCLSATSYNLGSLWMTYPLIVKEEIKTYFNLPYELVSAICIGKMDHLPSNRPRKLLKEVLLDETSNF